MWLEIKTGTGIKYPMICNCNQCYQLLGRGDNTENILFADDESNFPKSNQSFVVT